METEILSDLEYSPIIKDKENDELLELLTFYSEDGLKPKKYDQKKYNDTFKEKNKDKVKEKIECPICFGTYTYFNKSKHNLSKRHQKFLNLEKSTPTP